MTTTFEPRVLGPAQLAERAQAIAGRPEEWIHRVRLSTDGRWYERLHSDAEHEIWLISWLPGQATCLHDHGGASGAFAVALGSLGEHRVDGGRAPGPGPPGGFRRPAAPPLWDPQPAPPPPCRLTPLRPRAN